MTRLKKIVENWRAWAMSASVPNHVIRITPSWTIIIRAACVIAYLLSDFVNTPFVSLGPHGSSFCRKYWIKAFINLYKHKDILNSFFDLNHGLRFVNRVPSAFANWTNIKPHMHNVLSLASEEQMVVNRLKSDRKRKECLEKRVVSSVLKI